ncbi:MAG TPA: DUF3006 domain-containing protein [Clostridia bacterium]|nr:DUF3006 domain-containing protein [Clostridia bacterium]
MIIIDRFEGDAAVCEDGDEQILIPRASLPSHAGEGDVVVIRDDGTYGVDQAATERRRTSIASRFAKLTSCRRGK